jgi:hypothetical protein
MMLQNCEREANDHRGEREERADENADEEDADGALHWTGVLL